MSETAGVVGDGGGLGCHGVTVCGEHPNHLGIVAEVCREVEVADWLDQQEPSHRQYVSVGTARVAMALNGLGFSNRRLYLTPQFYADKPDGLPLVAQFVGQLLC